MNLDLESLALEDITTKCSPVAPGHIVGGGWNWSYPAIAHIKGTAGTLDAYVVGYEDKWVGLDYPFEEKISFFWQARLSRETAFQEFETL